ncbi:type II toxin-antitoxin system RelE/ParE family toxin [uncultured Thiohalocapsa sp.]|uniref:type II toxin-antitoxin system RelE family toxin n=1 Tax=uncultured Thiohalocapsa sp. TaxID=768990 RepID=UPI0025ED7154|nr:type II toxin-antitoxin system RelE/ParE family toxin [uncultured Thiohalocapsa sp.]
MYRVSYKRQATRLPARMSAVDRKRILTALEQLARSPRSIDLDTKRLEGRNGFRLRVGGWRVLYDLDDDRLIVLVLQIGSRGDAYR